jgi:hypothetical protein
MKEKTEGEILCDAITKNQLGILGAVDQPTLLALIRYARNIGYSEGYEDRRQEGAAVASSSWNIDPLMD